MAHKQVPTLRCAAEHTGQSAVLRGRRAPPPQGAPPTNLAELPSGLVGAARLSAWDSDPGEQHIPSYPEANEKLETGTVIVMLSLGYANKI